MDLDYGELGVYGDGATRGAPTPRIDKLVSKGLRLTSMDMETLAENRRSRACLRLKHDRETPSSQCSAARPRAPITFT